MPSGVKEREYRVEETEIPKHMEDTDLSFLDDLLLWSEKLPKEIKRQVQICAIVRL